MSIGEVFFDTSSGSILPSLVDKNDLVKANSILATSATITNGAVGPALGGILFSYKPSIPFAINLLSFCIAVLLISTLVRLINDETKKEKNKVRVADGFTYCFRNKKLRGLLFITSAWSLFGWMPEGTLVLFVKEGLKKTSRIW